MKRVSCYLYEVQSRQLLIHFYFTHSLGKERISHTFHSNSPYAFPPLRLPFCIEALNRLRYAWFHRAWNLSFDAFAFASCLQFEESDVLIRRDRAKTKQKRTGVRYLSARLSVHRIGKSFVEVKNYLCFMRGTFFFPPYYVVVIGAYNISPETIRL